MEFLLSLKTLIDSLGKFNKNFIPLQVTEIVFSCHPIHIHSECQLSRKFFKKYQEPMEAILSLMELM